jgi:hypothetical protein
MRALPAGALPAALVDLEVFVDEPSKGLVFLRLAVLDVERKANPKREDHYVDRYEIVREAESAGDEAEILDQQK